MLHATRTLHGKLMRIHAKPEKQTQLGFRTLRRSGCRAFQGRIL